MLTTKTMSTSTSHPRTHAAFVPVRCSRSPSQPRPTTHFTASHLNEDAVVTRVQIVAVEASQPVAEVLRAGGRHEVVAAEAEDEAIITMAPRHRQAATRRSPCSLTPRKGSHLHPCTSRTASTHRTDTSEELCFVPTQDENRAFFAIATKKQYLGINDRELDKLTPGMRSALSAIAQPRPSRTAAHTRFATYMSWARAASRNPRSVMTVYEWLSTKTNCKQKTLVTYRAHIANEMYAREWITDTERTAMKEFDLIGRYESAADTVRARNQRMFSDEEVSMLFHLPLHQFGPERLFIHFVLQARAGTGGDLITLAPDDFGPSDV